MKTVFVDTHYWIAIVDPHDSWKKTAKEAKDSLGDVIMVTTDEVSYGIPRSAFQEW